MSMTHREALNRAVLVWLSGNKGLVQDWHGDQMQSAIRAYIEARGLVLVPKTATEKMQRHGVTGLCCNGLGDVDYSDARECYKAMLAAAPDQFAEGE